MTVANDNIKWERYAHESVEVPRLVYHLTKELGPRISRSGLEGLLFGACLSDIESLESGIKGPNEYYNFEQILATEPNRDLTIKWIKSIANEIKNDLLRENSLLEYIFYYDQPRIHISEYDLVNTNGFKLYRYEVYFNVLLVSRKKLATLLMSKNPGHTTS